jgi:hypothetical protein
MSRTLSFNVLASQKLQKEVNHVKILVSLLELKQEIDHEATYELQNDIVPDSTGEVDWGRGSFPDTWARTNHLYPFDGDISEDGELPTKKGDRVTFDLQLDSDRSPSEPLSTCFAAGCKYHRNGDLLFCSQHTAEFETKSVKELEEMAEKHLVKLQQGLQMVVSELEEPAKEIVVNYARELDDGEFDFDTLAVLKRVDWKVIL